MGQRPPDEGSGAGALLAVLSNHDYRRLFYAQTVALLGTGLLTVALGLLAFQIAGGDAGIVLGTALTIKMIAYVTVTPIMSAAAVRLSRKTSLLAANLVRAAVAASLVLVTETWHIYLLIFVLQSASATFTPTFQATIPDIIPDEREYTRAISLSRLAYDLEALVSPMLAAALLTVISYNGLFVGTTVGFVASALLVATTTLPPTRQTEAVPFRRRLTLGARIFARTPELRALGALNLSVAAVTAMVIVNTVVFVQAQLGRPQSDVAILLASYGIGSMIVALTLPRLLDRISERPVMLTGGLTAAAGLIGVATVTFNHGSRTWILALAVWLVLGAATSLVLTPSARLLRRASSDTNRPAVFAAQFALSHACFAMTYPLAGFLGAAAGLPMTATVLGVIAAAAMVVGALAWQPQGQVAAIEHRHWHRHGWAFHTHAHSRRDRHHDGGLMLSL